MQLTTCAFTGYRPHRFPWKGNEADSRCIALKATITDQTAALAGSGVTSFFTGGAAGVDCWTALIVLGLREKNPALKLHRILPYEGQADEWDDSERERYHTILKQADSVEYVSRDHYDGCMMDRNHRLAEAAAFLCTDCLNKILPSQSERCFGVGAIHLDTKEVRVFEKQLGGFGLGDFHVDCSLTGQDGEKMNILIFYCPIRYKQES